LHVIEERGGHPPVYSLKFVGSSADESNGDLQDLQQGSQDTTSYLSKKGYKEMIKTVLTSTSYL
jgi:hypothetical protein